MLDNVAANRTATERSEIAVRCSDLLALVSPFDIFPRLTGAKFCREEPVTRRRLWQDSLQEPERCCSFGHASGGEWER